MKARSARQKGTRLERWVTGELKALGLKARRQPGSGVYADFPHDATFELPAVRSASHAIDALIAESYERYPEGCGGEELRAWLSSRLVHWPHDRTIPVIVECKARREGHRTLDRWIGQADLLVIRRDRAAPMVYMTWEMLRTLLLTPAPGEE